MTSGGVHDCTGLRYGCAEAAGERSLRASSTNGNLKMTPKKQATQTWRNLASFENTSKCPESFGYRVFGVNNEYH